MENSVQFTLKIAKIIIDNKVMLIYNRIRQGKNINKEETVVLGKRWAQVSAV